MCLPVIAGAVMAAGTLFQGYSAMQQGKFEAGVDKQNAAMEREAAAESIRSGQSERRDYWRKVGNVKGQQVASIAANGIDVGYGTAARIQEDTQQLANEDADTLYRNQNERTKGFIINAWNDKMAAKAAKAKGTTAMIGSVFGAASSVMGGFQQQSALKAKMGN